MKPPPFTKQKADEAIEALRHIWLTLPNAPALKTLTYYIKVKEFLSVARHHASPHNHHN